MSVTLSPGSRRSEKSTCRKCGRTVLLLVGEDLRRYEVDPELLNVFPFEHGKAFEFARRAHADLCDNYKIEGDKAKIRAEMKAANKADKAAAMKRPRGMKREPGQ